MEIGIQDIYFELGRVLEAIYPGSNLKVHEERIADLVTPAVSIELVQFSTPQHSKNIINKRVDLDLIYYSETDTVREALSMVSPLMGAFSMGLKVYERDMDGNILRDDKGKMVYSRFIHCLRPPEYTLVDQDLHFMVTFEWAEAFKPYYVTIDEKHVGGELKDKEPIVTDYDTANESLDNKEIIFEDDVDDAKYRAYLDEPYQMMSDLHTNMESLQALIEIKKG